MPRLFRKRSDVRSELDCLLEAPGRREIFRAYYLNEEKINEFFVQEYGGITGYSKSHASEVSSEIGGGVKTGRLTSLIAELEAQVRLGKTKSSGETQTYEIPNILRFRLLRRYWPHRGKLLRLGEADVAQLSTPHTLVAHTGDYRFAKQATAIELHLTGDQRFIIGEQMGFEQEAEDELHYLYLTEAPKLAVAILSGRFITHAGFRFLPDYSGKKSSTQFTGAVIGFKQDILFLDPIAIGEDTPVS